MENVSGNPKPLSQMTPAELRQVMQECQERGRVAYEEDLINELLVLRTRYFLAASYLLNPDDFHAEETYYVEGEEGLFTITHLDGIMAHGHMSGSPFPVAFPIAMLSNELGNS